MVLDDKDFMFKGCYDLYWYCPKCLVACVEKFRYGKSVSTEWYYGNYFTAVKESGGKNEKI